jgi:hypothetical protein
MRLNPLTWPLDFPREIVTKHISSENEGTYRPDRRRAPAAEARLNGVPDISDVS